MPLERPAIKVECAQWLVDKGVRAAGTDAMAFDKSGAKDAPVHNVLLPAGFILIEEMFLPVEILERRRWGFCFFPLPIQDAASARCRAVAIEWEE